MARIKRGMTTKARHKKVMAQTKGFRGRSNNTFRAAVQRLLREHEAVDSYWDAPESHLGSTIARLKPI